MIKLDAAHDEMVRLVALGAGVEDAGALSREKLVSINAQMGVLLRRLGAVQVDVAAAIAFQSRPELGANSLAKEQGFRTPEKLISTTTGVSTGEAKRFIKVGEATAPRADFVGKKLPARYPLVEAALAAGDLHVQAASLITALLDDCRVSAGSERITEGERVLVESCKGLGLDEVRKLIVRAEAWLDPDGIELREMERHARRSLTFIERDGMVYITAVLDAVSAAPVVTALRGFVSAAFSARKDTLDPDSPDADRRTVAMLYADALTLFASHVLGCTEAMPLAGATMIVRMNLEDVENGTGSATIDGMDQPVSVGAARRMAANGGIIPWVLGGDSEILDWGREKRLFTRSQRLALAERDGGCAMCSLPPEMTKAHHIQWWKRHHGRTDLANGVLLCETCHHRIHDNGWDIRIEGIGVKARVWFIPPPYVDPAQKPRLGGRGRFDLVA